MWICSCKIRGGKGGVNEDTAPVILNLFTTYDEYSASSSGRLKPEKWTSDTHLFEGRPQSWESNDNPSVAQPVA
jgi:hypothetical protein